MKGLGEKARRVEKEKKKSEFFSFEAFFSLPKLSKKKLSTHRLDDEAVSALDLHAVVELFGGEVDKVAGLFLIFFDDRRIGG